MIGPIQQKRILVFLLVIGLVGIAAYIPIPQTLGCACRIESPVIWFLAKEGAGEITTGWERNILSREGSSVLFNFERPDFIEVAFSHGLENGASVKSGDTLAVIASREGLGRIQVLEAELEKARANLTALKAGSRAEDLEVALKKMERAEKELASFRLEHTRKKALFDSNFISLSELQLSEGRLNVLETELSLAAAEMRALQAGARPEDVKVAEEEIARLEKSIASALSALGRKEYITTPVEGRLYLGGAPNYLLKVESADTVAVVISIPEAVIPALKPGLNISVRLFADNAGERSCRLFKTAFFDSTVQGAYAVGLLANPEGELEFGMTGRASIPMGKTTLIEGLKARLSSL